MHQPDEPTAAPHLPDWLDQYVLLPVWAMVRSIKSGRIRWVNEELARDNDHPRNWFVDQVAADVWPDTARWQHLDAQAVAEGRTLDTIVDGRDRLGMLRWFKAHRTPVDTDLILVVLDDVTADVKLASMRLMLGRNLALESHTRLDQRFARQLLEGVSLDELCGNDEARREEVRGTLALLVSEGIAQPVPWQNPPEVQAETAGALSVPEWIRCCDDLPIPTAVIARASREVLWINAVVVRNNERPREALIGRNIEEIWSGAEDLPPLTGEAMVKGQTLESIHVGRNLVGDQRWGLVRQIPLTNDQVLLCATDVTAKLRLHALRIILGLKSTTEPAPHLEEPFVRLLLKGATLANICAALELSPQAVLGNLAAMTNA